MSDTNIRRGGLLLLLTLLLTMTIVSGQRAAAQEDVEQTLVPRLYLPSIARSGGPTSIACAPAGGFGTVIPEGPPTDRPASVHADLNLALRGYTPTGGTLGLVDYGGATDPGAPQLYGLFANQRTPTFVVNHRVRNWDWGCNCRAGVITRWPVTLTEVATQGGESLRLPDRAGGDIGQGYKAMVLYATPTRITLKYTREDNVIQGYTLHIENIRVNPTLLALYRGCNSAGRGQLPAIRPRQQIGTAGGSRLGIAIRDTGNFMDPRSRKDWWRGR